MLYFYLSHMGGYYVSEYEIEDLYCNTCGDSDTFLGCFNLNTCGDSDTFLGCFNLEETFLDRFPEYKEV